MYKEWSFVCARAKQKPFFRRVCMREKDGKNVYLSEPYADQKNII